MATASPKSSSQISTLDDAPASTSAEVAAPAALVGPSNQADFSGKKEMVTIHSVPGEGGGDAVFPVSYTHLTLPTNREV